MQIQFTVSSKVGNTQTSAKVKRTQRAIHASRHSASDFYSFAILGEERLIIENLSSRE